MKKTFSEELSYFLGVLLLALGTVLCAKADLGMSMIAAPSFCLASLFGGYMGFAEALVQATLLLDFCLVMRRFRVQYLFSFVTALLYSGALNLLQLALSAFVPTSLWARVPLFLAGNLLVCLAVAFFFHTYLAPEVYELFVKGLCEKYRLPVGRTKLVFDSSMLLLSILLAILVYGLIGKELQNGLPGLLTALRRGGVYIGTLVSTLFSGMLISLYDRFLKKRFAFAPSFPKLRRVLSDREQDKEAS